MRLASHKLPCKTKFVKSDRTFTEEELASFAEIHVTEEDLIPSSVLEEELLEEEEAAAAVEDSEDVEGDSTEEVETDEGN